MTVNLNIVGVSISAIDTQLSEYPKCLDLIFLYLPGLMISTGNDQILLQSDFAAL
jgi:hypothetical protein